MLSRNNKKLQAKKMEPKQQHFAIKKFTIGVASVLIGSMFAFYSGATDANAKTTTTLNVSALTGGSATNSLGAVTKSATDMNGLTVEDVPNLENVDYATSGFAPTVSSTTQVEVHNGFVHKAGTQNLNRFPVMVNASILNKDPNSIKDKPYVILKNVGTYQGRQLDMKIEMVDWRKQIKNGGTAYAEAHLYNDPRGKGFGFSGSANGLDYVTYREHYLDSQTGEEVGVKAHRSLLDIDKNELFAISNASGVTAYKRDQKLKANTTSSPVGTVFFRQIRSRTCLMIQDIG